MYIWAEVSLNREFGGLDSIEVEACGKINTDAVARTTGGGRNPLLLKSPARYTATTDITSPYYILISAKACGGSRKTLRITQIRSRLIYYPQASSSALACPTSL